jgi:pimeloyl-ACP methyl ester carboxylesterase
VGGRQELAGIFATGPGGLVPLTIHRYGSSDARTVVLVHGLTEAGTTWPDLVGHWGDNWHVLAPDLRGHGQSPRFTEDEVAPAPEVLLADVITVVDAQPAACDTNARCARL